MPAETRDRPLDAGDVGAESEDHDAEFDRLPRPQDILRYDLRVQSGAQKELASTEKPRFAQATLKTVVCNPGSMADGRGFVTRLCDSGFGMRRR